MSDGFYVRTRLDKLDDVSIATTPSDGQTLTYDHTAALWKAATPAAGGYTTSQVDTLLAAKAPLASPTFTGIVTTPEIDATRIKIYNAGTDEYDNQILASNGTIKIFPAFHTEIDSGLTVQGGIDASSFSGDGTSLTGVLKTANNLSDVTASTARTNLSVYSTSQVDTSLAAKANLSGAAFTGNVSTTGTLTSNGMLNVTFPSYTDFTPFFSLNSGTHHFFDVGYQAGYTTITCSNIGNNNIWWQCGIGLSNGGIIGNVNQGGGIQVISGGANIVNPSLQVIGGFLPSAITLNQTTTILASASSAIPLIVKGATSQSANLAEWRNSSGTPLSKIKSDGSFSGPIDLNGNSITDNASGVVNFNTGIWLNGNNLDMAGGSIVDSNNGEISFGNGLNTGGNYLEMNGGSINMSGGTLSMGGGTLDCTSSTITNAALSSPTVNAGNLTLNNTMNIVVSTSTGSKIGTSTTQKIGFWGHTPTAQLTVTGSRASGAALTSLLTQLAATGIIVDSSTT